MSETPTNAPAAPAETVEPPAVEPEAPVEKTFTQAEVNALAAKLREEMKAKYSKPAEPAADPSLAEEVAALKAQLAATETAAVDAIIARAAAGTHDPAVVAKLIDRDGLISTDPSAIEAAVAAVLKDKPYLVKAADTAPSAPVVKAAPGAVNAPGNDRKLLSREELAQLAANPAELAKDENYRLYVESLEALRGR